MATITLVAVRLHDQCNCGGG